MSLNEKMKEQEMRVYIDRSVAAEKLVGELIDKGYSVRRIFTAASEPTLLYNCFNGGIFSGWCRIRRTFLRDDYIC